MNISNRTVSTTLTNLNININKVTNKILDSVNNYGTQGYEEIDYNSIDTNIDYSTQNSKDIFHYENISDDHFIAQGFTSNDKYYFIGAYDKDKKINSRIYIYDRITGEYLFYIETNNKSHMGGTSFDKNNNILFITNGTKDIKALNWDLIEMGLQKHKDEIKDIGFISYSILEDYIKLYSDSNDSFLIDTTGINMDSLSSSYSYCDDKYLYIGHFGTGSDPESHRILKRYELDYNKENNKLNIINKSEFPTPTGVQGVATYSKDGSDYIVFACSIFGSATLDTYEIKKNGELEQVSVFDLKKYKKNGVENIEIDKNGNLHAIFEFADDRYGKYAPTEYKSITISMNRLLKPNIFLKPGILNKSFHLIANAFYDDNPLVDEDDYGKTGAKVIAGPINLVESLHEASNNKNHNIIEKGIAKVGEYGANIIALPGTTVLFFDTLFQDIFKKESGAGHGGGVHHR